MQEAQLLKSVEMMEGIIVSTSLYARQCAEASLSQPLSPNELIFKLSWISIWAMLVISHYSS
jgi:hypothetical protein